jgi:hypothetical protein
MNLRLRSEISNFQNAEKWTTAEVIVETLLRLLQRPDLHEPGLCKISQIR